MPYNFTQEDFSKFSEDILKAGGDQATLTTLLADMQGTVTDAIALAATQQETTTRITGENERLKQANMELFLRVGSKAKEDTEPKVSEPSKPVDTETYMKNYFNTLDSTGKEK